MACLAWLTGVERHSEGGTYKTNSSSVLANYISPILHLPIKNFLKTSHPPCYRIPPIISAVQVKFTKVFRYNTVKTSIRAQSRAIHCTFTLRLDQRPTHVTKVLVLWAQHEE
ncbi:hypothetical protein PGTUg99_036598 [Puccinia graminis f. sp. tritici]|uniref:Uncharacterized protein n=1 Tax=Puccinia graminis f. sp. tritici TaxID=56615 RepID=A0A5B0RAI0_PUCGR|nr:hypothetical protein PGTUg99_036598 [Puccinia graminis f. sp. tritici]